MAVEVEFDTAEFRRALDVFDREIDFRVKASLHEVIDGAVNAAKAAAPVRTAVMRDSVQRGPTSGSVGEGSLEATMAAGAPYASFVEDGTREHTFGPKLRRWLRFPVKGAVRGGKANAGFAFAKQVTIPAQAARPFMGPAVDHARDTLPQKLDTSVRAAAQKAGLK